MNDIDRKPAVGTPGKLRLDKANGKFLGVCQGLANHFGMDPMIVRLIFVLGTLIGFGSFILRDKGERVGRNPKTGVEVPIAPRRVLTFRASQIMRERIARTG